MKPPCDRRDHTDDDRRYAEVLQLGYCNRRVYTSEDWGGTYHEGSGRYPDPDEHGEVCGGWLEVDVYSPTPYRVTWRIAVWGTDDTYVVRSFDNEAQVEAALRRMPTIVTRDILAEQGYKYE